MNDTLPEWKYKSLKCHCSRIFMTHKHGHSKIRNLCWYVIRSKKHSEERQHLQSRSHPQGCLVVSRNYTFFFFPPWQKYKIQSMFTWMWRWLNFQLYISETRNVRCGETVSIIAVAIILRWGAPTRFSSGLARLWWLHTTQTKMILYSL